MLDLSNLAKKAALLAEATEEMNKEIGELESALKVAAPGVKGEVTTGNGITLGYGPVKPHGWIIFIGMVSTSEEFPFISANRLLRVQTFPYRHQLVKRLEEQVTSLHQQIVGVLPPKVVPA